MTVEEFAKVLHNVIRELHGVAREKKSRKLKNVSATRTVKRLVTNKTTKDHLEWDDLTIAIKDSRRNQARFLMEKFPGIEDLIK